LLNQGDADGALRHFREALRRDPSLDGARAGLVEALKARNPLYRLVLGGFLWLDRFSAGKQRQILIGAWLVALVGSRALRGAGHETAAAVVSYSWLSIVLLTALTVPVFNLLLLLHPLGRHALERQARNDAILLGVTLLAAAGVALHAWLVRSPWSLASWPFWLVFLLPVAGIGAFWSGWARRVLQVFCVLLLAAWIWWAVHLLSLVPESVRRDQVEEFQRVLREHVRLQRWLIGAAAWSTWFVMLAPKGRPRRRRA
jgi:hypothetical protein